jgi:hypothetical protein
VRLSDRWTPASNICRPSRLVQSISKSQFSVSVRADPTRLVSKRYFLAVRLWNCKFIYCKITYLSWVLRRYQKSWLAVEKCLKIVWTVYWKKCLNNYQAQTNYQKSSDDLLPKIRHVLNCFIFSDYDGLRDVGKKNKEKHDRIVNMYQKSWLAVEKCLKIVWTVYWKKCLKIHL